MPLSAQNSDFDTKMLQAREKFRSGQYEEARAFTQSLMKLKSLSEEQKNEGKSFIHQCDVAILHRDRLVLSPSDMNIGSQGGLDSIACDAGNPKSLTVISSNPVWCQPELAEGYILLRTGSNPLKAERSATVTVKMKTVKGRVKSASIRLTQDSRPDTRKKVVVNTKPGMAKIYIDDNEPLVGVWEGELGSGEHRVRVEKNGYAPLETKIFVEDDGHGDVVKNEMLTLRPEFGTLVLDILPEEGFSLLDAAPVIKFNNGNTARLKPDESYSYDDDRDIVKYAVYSDGTMPVSAGRLVGTVNATGFEPQEFDIQIKNGEMQPLSITLKAITGFLTLDDEGKAQDALVIMDGQEMGLLRDFSLRRTIIGEHVVKLRKNGFVSEETSYAAIVQVGEATVVPVRMFRYAKYVFTSKPEGVRISIDGEFFGVTPTPPIALVESTPGQEHKVVFSKEGFLSVSRVLRPEYDNPEVTTEDVALQTTERLSLRADRMDVKASIYSGTHSDSLLYDGLSLPAEIDLPLRETPYKLEIRHVSNSRLMYRRNFKFNNSEVDKLKVQTYTKSNVQIIGANYFLNGLNYSVGSGNKEYRNMGSVNLVKFRLFPGFSTSVVHAGFFKAKDTDVAVLYTNQSGAVENTVAYGNYNYLPSVSILFINGEFRVGGYVTDYMQVNAVATYAWYPDFLKNFLGFSHVVGHDLFVGAEVSSCIPVFNLKLKAGVQIYPGGLTANFYKGSNSSNGSDSMSSRYVSLPMQGVPPAQFVVSLGFTLGGKDAKGENIWRVFHL